MSASCLRSERVGRRERHAQRALGRRRVQRAKGWLVSCSLNQGVHAVMCKSASTQKAPNEVPFFYRPRTPNEQLLRDEEVEALDCVRRVTSGGGYSSRHQDVAGFQDQGLVPVGWKGHWVEHDAAATSDLFTH